MEYVSKVLEYVFKYKCVGNKIFYANFITLRGENREICINWIKL